MTPRQFDALIKRHRHRIESLEFMLGQMTSWIANTGFRPAEKHTTALDFMPSQWAKKAKAKSSTPKRIRMTKKRRLDLFYKLRAELAPRATKVNQ